MRIALAQLNYLVGDFEGNLEKITRSINEAQQKNADLVVFSELSICGYPPLDLLERKDLVSRSIRQIEILAGNIPPGIGVLVGSPELNPEKEGKLLFNSAFFLYDGIIQQVFRKTLLPTYDIFDEYRYFEPGRDFRILEFKGTKLAITICEDLWDEQPFDTYFSRSRLYTTRPLDELAKYHPEAVINLAASPFSHQRMDIKRSIFTSKARKHQIPVLYCNQVGANTELIFEGGSLFINDSGSIEREMAFFREDLQVMDLSELKGSGKDSNESYAGKGIDRIRMLHEALVCGITDYFEKTGFSTATLGLSGGIDSAVTLALAEEALGAENLHVLLMPSQYSSGHSVSDSVKLAENLGVRYDILSIADLFDQFRGTLEPVFKGMPEDIAEENIQARIRGTLLMALSNKYGYILLNTSNKSETAVGYGTLYGDMSGGLSVLGDVYKTDVYELARDLNREKELIPVQIIHKAPSAELRPDQRDTDSLPEYALLDKILEAYIEKQLPPEEVTGLGYEPEVVKRIIRLVDQNEYKRYQTPPILRVSSKAFGVGRRLPLVARYE